MTVVKLNRPWFGSSDETRTHRPDFLDTITQRMQPEYEHDVEHDQVVAAFLFVVHDDDRVTMVPSEGARWSDLIWVRRTIPYEDPEWIAGMRGRWATFKRTEAEAEAHAQRNLAERPHVCRYANRWYRRDSIPCGKRFASERGRNQHERMVHKDQVRLDSNVRELGL